MGRQPTNRLRVSGYRFLVRRLEHALVRGDVRMLDDPQRAQSLSLIVGCVLAVIAVAGCAIFALIRPHGGVGDASIVLARESGALYVRIDDTLHPVLNLASARLVAGTASDPRVASESEIAKVALGPTVGIRGAPAVIAAPLTAEESGWTVCDAVTAEPAATTLIAGPVRLGGGTDRVDAGQGVLVRARAEAAMTYLLYGGQRARVDLRNAAVVRALRLDGVEPLPVSRSLLDAFPEVPEIVAPPILNVGARGPATLAGFTVGAVVRMVRADTADFYVVLTDGVQRIGEVTADLIRFTVAQADREIRTVPADVLAAVPSVDALPVSTFPGRMRVVEPVLVCARWTSTELDTGSNTGLLVGDSLPLDRHQEPVRLAQADADGPHIDEVVVPAGRSAYIRSTGLTGRGGTGGPLYLISELGVMFGLHDETVADDLGLSMPPVPAPWPLLASLPRGPGLNRDAASVIRDGIPPA